MIVKLFSVQVEHEDEKHGCNNCYPGRYGRRILQDSDPAQSAIIFLLTHGGERAVQAVHVEDDDLQVDHHELHRR